MTPALAPAFAEPPRSGDLENGFEGNERTNEPLGLDPPVQGVVLDDTAAAAVAAAPLATGDGDVQ